MPYMYLSTLQCAMALAADVSLVFTLLGDGDWARISTSAKHYFSTFITTMVLDQGSIQHAVLDLSE